jgi:hypothetical protein
MMTANNSLLTRGFQRYLNMSSKVDGQAVQGIKRGGCPSVVATVTITRGLRADSANSNMGYFDARTLYTLRV